MYAILFAGIDTVVVCCCRFFKFAVVSLSNMRGQKKGCVVLIGFAFGP